MSRSASVPAGTTPDTKPQAGGRAGGLPKSGGEDKGLYSAGAKDFGTVDVPAISYLMVDGHGDPNSSPDYAAAVEALFTVAYAVKFDSKLHGRDYTVGPLEGLWTADDPAAFTAGDKNSWDWTMMVAQPEWIGPVDIASGIAKASIKKPGAALADLRLETLAEGLSVQILHIGSYDNEAPTLHRLHTAYMPEHNLAFNGAHHEIYLSDARRVEPAKLKTILRQPVVRR